MFGILSVSALNLGVQIQAVPRIERKTETAVEAAREASSVGTLIRECNTPGTECYNFRQAEDAAELAEAQKRGDAQVQVLTAQNRCVIEVLIFAPPPGPDRIAHAEDMRKHYDECVAATAAPVPAKS